MTRTLQSLFFLLCCIGMSYAQVSVNVTVDVSNEMVDATGVHVAGNWDPDNEWQPGAFPMNDNGDGTWSLDLSVPENTTFEYKFLLGNDWSLGNEGINDQASCIVGDGNSNRTFTTGTATNDTVAMVCYNSCGPCKEAGQSSVSFSVDLSQEATINEPVYLSGSFPEMWNEAYEMTSYKNDGVYAITLNLDPGDYLYKFRNGPDGWESVPTDCVFADGNRGFTLADEDLYLATDCINKCGPCIAVNTLNVKLQVDMTNVAATTGISADGVSVAGSFQSAAGLGGNWSPGVIFLTDDDGDLVYEIDFTLPEGEYQFKYLNGNNWGTEESIPEDCILEGTPNRGMTIAGAAGENVTIGPICFGECGAECSELLDPVNVTFRVDMTQEFVAAEGLFVAGDFNEGAKWDKDTFEMVENVDIAGLYEFTTMIRPGKKYAYKYFNNGTDDGQESFNFIDGGCGVDNGFGGSNRLLDLSMTTADTLISAYIFNSCSFSTLVNNEEINYTDAISTYPNPVNNIWTVEIGTKESLAHKIEIYDITGNLVLSSTMTTAKIQSIDVSSLHAGMYIAQIINENNATTSIKMIKE